MEHAFNKKFNACNTEAGWGVADGCHLSKENEVETRRRGVIV